MTDRELMQQALEEEANPWTSSLRQSLRARLAEPDDEPVGHVTVRRLSKRFENHTDQHVFYPAGQSPYLDNVDECFPVYTRPAARNVQPLTPSQVHELCQECYLDWHRGWSIDEEPNRYLLLARAIERAHGITGDSHD